MSTHHRGTQRTVGAIIHYALLVPHDDRGRNELWPLQRVPFFWQRCKNPTHTSFRTRARSLPALICSSMQQWNGWYCHATNTNTINAIESDSHRTRPAAASAQGLVESTLSRH